MADDDPAVEERPSFLEARARVLAAIGALGVCTVPLAEAVGSMLAEDVVAPRDDPAFDTSAMDGYAVASEDVERAPVTVEVVTVSSAGRPAPRSIGRGEAARILTGAALVSGADCVVPVEDTDGGTDRVRIHVSGRRGANIRSRGEAARRGDVVIARGTVLNAAHLGVVAGTGRARLEVVAHPRVAIVSTGDELVPAGHGDLAPGQIFESNGVVLGGLVHAMGCRVTVTSAGDDAAELRGLIHELADSHDLVLSTGGVSMGGEYDALRAALHGDEVEFWKMAIKPAKPMAFGRIGDTALFGLPGNPASAVVAFEVFVRPAIRKLCGIEPHVVPTFDGIAGSDLSRRRDDRTHFVGVRRTADGRWVPTGRTGLGGLAAAEALAVLPPEAPATQVGSALSLLPLWG